MKKALEKLMDVVLKTNEKKTKVEQKQARAIKDTLTKEVIKDLIENGFDVKYDETKNPLIVLPNDLIIGFNFVVKNLNTETYTEEDLK